MSLFFCKCTWFRIFSLTLVSFHVQGQVVRAGEAAAAHGTLERLGPGVFSHVAGQLVGAGEAPLTSFPGARVRFLPFRKYKEQSKRGSEHFCVNK